MTRLTSLLCAAAAVVCLPFAAAQAQPKADAKPTEVKLAVVGKGGAEKAQIQHMVGLMLNLHGKLQADAADALAIAITHAHVRATARRLGVNTQQAWSRK